MAENKFYIAEPCNVMAIVKVEIEENQEHLKPSFQGWKFSKEPARLMKYFDEDAIRCMVGNDCMAKISKEYFDKAKKINKLWDGGDLNVYLREQEGVIVKDHPVLLSDGDSDLGFILAPRVEDDE